MIKSLVVVDVAARFMMMQIEVIEDVPFLLLFFPNNLFLMPRQILKKNEAGNWRNFSDEIGFL